MQAENIISDIMSCNDSLQNIIAENKTVAISENLLVPIKPLEVNTYIALFVIESDLTLQPKTLLDLIQQLINSKLELSQYKFFARIFVIFSLL